MTNKRLAEIRARCEAATEGPWYAINVVIGDSGKRTGIYADERPSNSVAYCFRFTDDIVPDGIFIAHARQDLPDCRDEIERLRGLVENAFFEALHYANPDALNPDQQAWMHSEARKALEE